jgi:hypothetical protein
MNGNYESLVTLSQEIERIETVKKDFLVPTKDAEMIEDSFIHFGGKEDFKIDDLAHNQLSSYTGIPKKYYDRMEAIPGLRTQNVNAWLHNNTEDRRLVRTLDNRVRAILSDSYKPVDHMLILKAFLPAIYEHTDLMVKASALTSSRLYLQIVFPKIEGEVEKGDIVQAGITLTNSETGQGAVDISTFLYRLICKNGMIGESILRKIHLGRKIGEDVQDYDIFTDETIKAEMESFRLRLRDSIKYAFSEASFNNQLLQMRRAAGIVVQNPKAVCEEVTKRYGLTSSESDTQMNNFFKEKTTAWGLANSLTALAHTIENPDRQYQMECAGNDITLKPEEWERIK